LAKALSSVEPLMPRPAASSLNASTQAGKPLPSLPHLAASAAAGTEAVAIIAASTLATLFVMPMKNPVISSILLREHAMLPCSCHRTMP
jgi:hypothetical protein